MTFREKLADWISGGKLTALRRIEWESRDRANRIALQADGALCMCRKWRAKSEEARARLDRIAAQETPGANATVRRMCRIARGEE